MSDMNEKDGSLSSEQREMYEECREEARRQRDRFTEKKEVLRAGIKAAHERDEAFDDIDRKLSDIISNIWLRSEKNGKDAHIAEQLDEEACNIRVKRKQAYCEFEQELEYSMRKADIDESEAEEQYYYYSRMLDGNVN